MSNPQSVTYCRILDIRPYSNNKKVKVLLYEGLKSEVEFWVTITSPIPQSTVEMLIEHPEIFSDERVAVEFSGRNPKTGQPIKPKVVEFIL